MDLQVMPASKNGDRNRRPSREAAEAAVRILLSYAGDDPDREGLLETPARVARAYEEIFAGYAQEPEQVLSRVFEEVSGYDEMVLVANIPFISHCEHHMAPFHGLAHVGYFPRTGVVGLSKIARLVEIYARRLQTQEAMTAQIAAAMEEYLNPYGVAVMIGAEHMCMTMRGVAKPGAITWTMRFLGRFREDPAEQMRFIKMARDQK